MTEYMKTNGVLTNLKFKKTTGELEAHISFPKEMANVAFERLGGFPDPAKSRHVALFVLNEDAAKGDT